MFPVVHCPALNSTFAEVSSTGTEFGVTVNITCSAGYRIGGGQTTATVQCNSTGQWSSNDSCLRTFVILYLCDRMGPVTVSSDVLRQLSVFLSDLAACSGARFTKYLTTVLRLPNGLNSFSYLRRISIILCVHKSFPRGSTVKSCLQPTRKPSLEVAPTIYQQHCIFTNDSSVQELKLTFSELVVVSVRSALPASVIDFSIVK